MKIREVSPLSLGTLGQDSFTSNHGKPQTGHSHWAQGDREDSPALQNSVGNYTSPQNTIKFLTGEAEYQGLCMLTRG